MCHRVAPFPCCLLARPIATCQRLQNHAPENYSAMFLNFRCSGECVLKHVRADPFGDSTRPFFLGTYSTTPNPPRTYYLGTGALKGPLRTYYLGTWGLGNRACPRIEPSCRRRRSSSSRWKASLEVGPRSAPRSEAQPIRYGCTWNSQLPKIMDPILPILSIFGHWAIVLGTFGGPGRCRYGYRVMTVSGVPF